jgi:hypothetical protein
VVTSGPKDGLKVGSALVESIFRRGECSESGHSQGGPRPGRRTRNADVDQPCPRQQPSRDGADVVVVALLPALGETTGVALSHAGPHPCRAVRARSSHRAGSWPTSASSLDTARRQASRVGGSKPRNRRTAPGPEIEGALSDLGESVAPAIAKRAAHADAFGSGQWIGGLRDTLCGSRPKPRL